MTSVSSRFRLRSQHALTYSGRPSDVGEPSAARRLPNLLAMTYSLRYPYRASDQFLVAALTIGVRPGAKTNAAPTRAAQDVNRRTSVRPVVERPHRRTAETNRRNLK